MKARLLRLGTAFALSTILATAINAQELPSAKTFIERIQAPVAAAADGNKPPVTLAERAGALAKEIGSLAPEQAATRWLELFDAEGKAPASMTRNFGGYPANNSDPLMSALPPPAAWPALQKAIDARPLPDAGRNRQRELALRALGHLLNGDSEWVRKNIEELQANSRNNEFDMPIRFRPGPQQTFMEMLLGPTEQPEAVADDFVAMLQVAEMQGRLEVPDLVTQVGPAKAEELLRKALATEGMLNVETGDETRRLAQKLALSMLDQLKIPQWSLVTVESIELFEALEKRFPAPSTQPARGILSGLFAAQRMNYERYRSERQQAEQMYLLGLVAAGRSDDVVRILKNAQPDPENRGSPYASYALRNVSRIGHIREVYDTLYKILSDNPDLAMWDLFREASVRTDHTTEMLELARKAAARPGLTVVQQEKIRDVLYSALLAADLPDEAVQVMQSILDARQGQPETRARLALRIAVLGRLLAHPQWIESGLSQALQLSNEITDERSGYTKSYLVQEIAQETTANGNAARAMLLIQDEIRRNNSQPVVPNRPILSSSQNQRLLALAAQIYHDAGRHADVLQLISDAPGWKASDLSEVMTVRVNRGVPLGVIAAEALLDAGKKDDARRIIHAVLDSTGGLDSAYALLVKIDGPACLGKLDELFARDRFEERPLIWRAVVLRNQRQLDEAEKAARQAISIDPSDGEQPRGDRMRVYAVLADILADKGNAEQAAFFRGVVQSIRMSEDADQLHSAGLLQRAIKMYNDALKLFADAYCIQSRLAIQLSEMGYDKLAEEHYIKAFELMPDSFGRVESHCFGCEHAFEGPAAQSIAERVFTKFAEERPNKPQVHYLLGYLRQSQGRYPQALASFKTAVKLDPEYLNAWKQMSELSSHLFVPQADRDAAALTILRLDPLHRHSDSSPQQLQEVHALKDLWDAVASAAKMQPARASNLLPLTASAAEQGRLKQTRQEHGEDVFDSQMVFNRQSFPSPAEAVGQTNSVRLLRSLMGPF